MAETPGAALARPAPTPGGNLPSVTPEIERDVRLKDLIRLIDSGTHELLSLDVFDTLVYRMVPAPMDVFYLVARALIRRGALYASSTPESFVRERIGAEDRARGKRSSHEVTLEQIYDEFPAGYLRAVAPQEVARTEFEVETELVRVLPGMPDVITRARGRGLRIALVSDTYFTREQIRALVGFEADHVLLSCERNVSKFQGLHGQLIREARVAPGKILHVGNDYIADVEGPAVFGIDRYWLRKFPDEFNGMVESELQGTLSLRSDYLPSDDSGITTLRSRAMFACASRYERWGAGVLGPIIAGFADWVVERCADLGISDVLCLMREGRILKQVIDSRRAGLATREFYGSRFSALKASIFEGSEEELRSFVLRPSPQKRGKLLVQLGLEADGSFGDPDETISPEGTLELIRGICRDRKARAKVVASSARARANLIRHLSSLAPIGRGATAAFVDLGYKGTVQACLQRICEVEKLDLRLHGLYLVTGGEVHATQAVGAPVEGWLAENGQPIAMAHTFMRSPEIVEQSLMADCGTTLAYDEAGAPILDEFRVPSEQRRQIGEIQSGLLTYARLWADHRAACARDDTAPLKRLYRAICIRSVARPLPVELDMFGDWQHDENFGSTSTRTLTSVSDLDDWELSHISAHQVASLPFSRLHWPFGFACGISPAMGHAVAGIFLRTIDPETFESADGLRRMIFYWDSGRGFNQKEAAVRDYSLNHRGRVWHRCTVALDHGTNRSYGFTIGLPGEVLQLTGITLHIRPRDGAAKKIRFSHEMIEKSGYDHLHGNLYLVQRDPALLSVRAEDLIDFTGTVDVDLFFSILPGA